MIFKEVEYNKEILAACPIYKFGFSPVVGDFIRTDKFSVLGVIWCEKCGNSQDTERVKLWFGCRFVCSHCLANISKEIKDKCGGNREILPAFCHCGGKVNRHLAVKKVYHGHAYYFKDCLCDACTKKYTDPRRQFSRSQLWLVR